MKILNLGCGTKVCSHPDVINVDWSIELRLRRNRLSRSLVSRFVRGPRRDRFNALPDNILVHNLSKGIPFEDNSVDVVYHSHLLEHLDRDVAERFVLEVKRILRPGGIQRIVVPDLERLCRSYLAHIEACSVSDAEQNRHDIYVEQIIEQSVRREAYGSSQQRRWLRSMENRVLGDARKRGETHQWMYDQVNLRALLLRAGFTAVEKRDCGTSGIPDWNRYGLDLNDRGGEYKEGSLYMESVK